MSRSRLLFERITKTSCEKLENYDSDMKFSGYGFHMTVSFTKTLENNNLIEVSISKSDIQQLNYPIMGKNIFLTL